MFGGEYPGGALYTRADWIEKNPKMTQALTNAIVNTLKWIHSHTPEEIMAKMPDELVGAGQGALSRGAQEHACRCTRLTGKMDPKGAQAVLDVFSQSSPDVAEGQDRPVEDLHQQVRRSGGQARTELSACHSALRTRILNQQDAAQGDLRSSASIDQVI